MIRGDKLPPEEKRLRQVGPDFLPWAAQMSRALADAPTESRRVRATDVWGSDAEHGQAADRC